MHSITDLIVMHIYIPVSLYICLFFQLLFPESNINPYLTPHLHLAQGKKAKSLNKRALADFPGGACKCSEIIFNK